MLTRSLERPSTGSHPIEVLIPEVRQETRRRRALQIAFTALVLVVAGSVGFLAIENPSARLPTRVLPPSRNPAPLRTVVLPAVTKVASSTCGANNRQGWFSEVHVIAAYELSASVLRSKSGFYGNSYVERLGPRRSSPATCPGRTQHCLYPASEVAHNRK